MKRFLTALLFLFSAASFGQTKKQIDSVTFCFHKYKVPAGCTALSEYQLKGDNYSIIWIYASEDMLQDMTDQFLSQMDGNMKKFTKQPITCYLLNNEVKGYRISYEKGAGTGYQLVAYGVANGQPVIVQLNLDKEPLTNEDIPEFPRQIIQLTK